MLRDLVKKRPTLQDVATRAGVSRTTASFVLNGRDEMRISDAASERVRRAARDLDYRPNFAARSLKTQLSRTVALLSDEVATDGYAGQIIEGSLAGAVANHHMLFIGEFGGHRRLEEQLIADFLARQVDGFVLASTFTRLVGLPQGLAEQSVVLANCRSRGSTRMAVVPDDVAAGHTAAEYLLSRGHAGGIYLVGETPNDLIGARDRRQGIEDALGLDGVELAGQIVCKWWPESAFEAVRAFLAEGHRPQALICLNDRVALGAYQSLAEARLPIPDAVSVLSFDDSVLASWLQPGLTSIGIPHYEIGKRAVELLLSSQPPAVHRLPMPLRERGSVASVA